MQNRLLIAIDPVSLEEIPQYEPFQLGHHYSHAVSPDKRKVAIAKYPDDEAQGELYRIDVPSWTEKKLSLSLSQRAELLTFDQEGQLWWVEENQDSSNLERFQLIRYDMKQEQRTKGINFPASFRPVEMRFLQKGDQLAVYGFVRENNQSGTAKLLIIQEEEIAHTISLDKVKEGISEIPSSPEIHLVKSVQAGLAWDLARDRLYVVDSEKDWIAEIDLLQGKVSKQGEIKQAKTLWERLKGGLLPQAEAKEMVETARRVEISPDGRQLYVVSVKGDVTKGKDGGERWRQTSTGMQVITTDTFRQVNQFSLPVNDVALSPDGRYLILEGILPVEGTSRAGSEYGKRSGVYLYDTQKMK